MQSFMQLSRWKNSIFKEFGSSYKGNQWLKITTVFDCEKLPIGIKILEFNYHGAHYLKPIIAQKIRY